MKSRLLTFAGVLAVLAVLGKFYATPLIAQVRAAVVKNIDEKGRNPYMQGAFASCFTGTSAFCDMVFRAVPANKRLVIEHVSANIGADTGTGINGTFLLVGGVVYSLPGRPMSTPTLVGVNESVLAYCEAGQPFTYRVVWDSVTGAGAVSSVVSGYLVDLTQ